MGAEGRKKRIGEGRGEGSGGEREGTRAVINKKCNPKSVTGADCSWR